LSRRSQFDGAGMGRHSGGGLACVRPKAAPADAGLGLIVQEMGSWWAPAICGSGVLQLGATAPPACPQITRRYLSSAGAAMRCRNTADALYLTRDHAGHRLRNRNPKSFEMLHNSMPR